MPRVSSLAAFVRSARLRELGSSFEVVYFVSARQPTQLELQEQEAAERRAVQARAKQD